MSANLREEPPPPDVPSFRLVDRPDIHSHMLAQLHSGSCGVYVHWSLFHSGKSTSARVVAKLIWKGAGRGIRYINVRLAALDADRTSAERWLRRVLGFINAGDDAKSIYECFLAYAQGNHTVIMLDEADRFLDMQGSDDVIRGLAHGALEAPRLFSILLCVSDPHNAVRILNLNGGTKMKLIGHGSGRNGSIPLFAKWSRGEIETFIIDTYSLPPRIFSRMLELGATAGTPEVISDIVEAGEADEDTDVSGTWRRQHDDAAKKWASRWTQGAVVISNV